MQFSLFKMEQKNATEPEYMSICVVVEIALFKLNLYSQAAEKKKKKLKSTGAVVKTVTIRF